MKFNRIQADPLQCLFSLNSTPSTTPEAKELEKQVCIKWNEKRKELNEDTQKKLVKLEEIVKVIDSQKKRRMIFYYNEDLPTDCHLYMRFEDLAVICKFCEAIAEFKFEPESQYWTFQCKSNNLPCKKTKAFSVSQIPLKVPNRAPDAQKKYFREITIDTSCKDPKLIVKLILWDVTRGDDSNHEGDFKSLEEIKNDLGVTEFDSEPWEWISEGHTEMGSDEET